MLKERLGLRVQQGTRRQKRMCLRTFLDFLLEVDPWTGRLCPEPDSTKELRVEPFPSTRGKSSITSLQRMERERKREREREREREGERERESERRTRIWMKENVC